MDRIHAHGVRIVGDSGPTVLLVHGLGGHPGHWDPIVAALSPRARCVTFAIAGSPGADPDLFSPLRHASLMGFADDISVLCAELGIRDAVYVGHSMSAMAGSLAAAADPGLFRRMVLLNASPRYIDEPETDYVGGFTQEQVDGILSAIASDFTLWAAGFGQLVMGNGENPQFADEFTSSLHEYSPEIASIVFRAAFTSDLRSFVPRVAVPVRVLQSAEDPAVPMATAQWLADSLPEARLQQLSSQGHFPHVVDPDEVIAAMAPFVMGDGL